MYKVTKLLNRNVGDYGMALGDKYTHIHTEKNCVHCTPGRLASLDNNT